MSSLISAMRMNRRSSLADAIAIVASPGPRQAAASRTNAAASSSRFDSNARSPGSSESRIRAASALAVAAALLRRVLAVLGLRFVAAILRAPSARRCHAGLLFCCCR
jgi:hypothetical protein